MQVLETTRRQRLFASNVLPCCWLYLIVPVPVVVFVLSSIGSISAVFGNLQFAGQMLIVLVLSYLIGVGIGVTTVFFVFGPILYHQALLNGGPFQNGDLVQIIAGSYRDRIGRIYGGSQHDTHRVDLGEEAKNNYSDIFADYQLLRVEAKTEPPGEVSPAT